MDTLTPQQLKKNCRALFDPKTPIKELERIIDTLAHTRQMEALQALEEFEKSSRAVDVEWIDSAVDECISGLLTPSNTQEEKDYIRVEIWQRYEDELFDMEEDLEDAITHKQQLEVEKEFLENIQKNALKEPAKLAVTERLNAMEQLIAQEENDISNLRLKIAGQKFLLEQIENAIESPFYRKYGKEYIDMEMYEDDEDWMYDDEDDDLPF
ncbi:MAG: hypothetical protein ACE5HI_08045 [bacterium]